MTPEIKARVLALVADSKAASLAGRPDNALRYLNEAIALMA